MCYKRNNWRRWHCIFSDQWAGHCSQADSGMWSFPEIRDRPCRWWLKSPLGVHIHHLAEADEYGSRCAIMNREQLKPGLEVSFPSVGKGTLFIYRNLRAQAAVQRRACDEEKSLNVYPRAPSSWYSVVTKQNPSNLSRWLHKATHTISTWSPFTEKKGSVKAGRLHVWHTSRQRRSLLMFCLWRIWCAPNLHTDPRNAKTQWWLLHPLCILLLGN